MVQGRFPVPRSLDPGLRLGGRALGRKAPKKDDGPRRPSGSITPSPYAIVPCRASRPVKLRSRATRPVRFPGPARGLAGPKRTINARLRPVNSSRGAAQTVPQETRRSGGRTARSRKSDRNEEPYTGAVRAGCPRSSSAHRRCPRRTRGAVRSVEPGSCSPRQRAPHQLVVAVELDVHNARPAPRHRRAMATASGRTSSSHGPSAQRRRRQISPSDRVGEPARHIGADQVGLTDESGDAGVGRGGVVTSNGVPRLAEPRPRSSRPPGRRSRALPPGRASRRPRWCRSRSASARTSPRTSARSWASRFENGSSSRSRSGAGARARARATRCCWPPESSCGMRWASPSQPSQLEQFGDTRRGVAVQRRRRRSPRRPGGGRAPTPGRPCPPRRRSGGTHSPLAATRRSMHLHRARRRDARDPRSGAARSSSRTRSARAGPRGRPDGTSRSNPSRPPRSRTACAGPRTAGPLGSSAGEASDVASDHSGRTSGSSGTRLDVEAPRQQVERDRRSPASAAGRARRPRVRADRCPRPHLAWRASRTPWAEAAGSPGAPSWRSRIPGPGLRAPAARPAAA